MNSSEEEIKKSVDEYSQKSEKELYDELAKFGITPESFDSFADMILPMLTGEQAERLRQIRERIIRP